MPAKDTESNEAPDASKSAQSKLDGIEAALRRASDKAIARAKAAGLEPVLANDPKTSKQPTGTSS